MEYRDVFLLENIIEYCEQILTSIRGLTLDSFSCNLDVRDACALRVLQIGELSGDLSEGLRFKHSDIPWHAIIGLRNIIAHEYGNVDTEVLWEIVRDDIPTLLQKCREIVA
ncbi:DUF86 domain-containing protein [Candidatus Saccharibacteria bacterium]|nr:DUF86 domain-containing protein [Candidatus Saccharibacteria bacterium]